MKTNLRLRPTLDIFAAVSKTHGMTDQKSSTSFFKDYLRPLVLRVGLPLFVWALLVQFADQRLVEATQEEMSSENGAGVRLWIFGGLSMLTSITGPIFSMMMIFFAIRAPQSDGLISYILKNLSWLFKEQLRAAGKMIFWGMLFILPGLWKFFEFMMIPFIVCLEPRYQRGEVDALSISRQVFYRIWGRMIFAVVLFLLTSLILTSVDEFRSFAEHPLSAVALVLVDLSIFVLFQWVLLRFWEKESHRVTA